MRKALVTGATGFIGHNIVRELRRDGIPVRALVRRGSDTRFLEPLGVEFAIGDLLDAASLMRAARGCTVLFHAAALYTFWSPDDSLIYRTNVQGTENILSAAREAGLRKAVFTSSEAAIGMEEGCAAGNERMEASLDHLKGAYKRSKLLAERVALRMNGPAMPVVVVNPTLPIGAWDVKPTPTGRIVTDYLNGRMFACLHTGLNVVDVGDVARGHILAMQKGEGGRRYLLGNRNLTLREILGILERISGIPAPRFSIPYGLALGAGWADEWLEGRLLGRSPRIPLAAVQASRRFRHFDCSRAVQELGLPQTPVETAFRKAVRWFIENGYITKPLRTGAAVPPQAPASDAITDFFRKGSLP